MPEFDHLVVCMMENHSFDNMLGVLGRGDGLTIGAGGRPTNSNPYGPGKRLRSFHLPSECQLVGRPSQTWDASQAQFDGGTCQGFAESASGAVAMGYYEPTDMPFTSSLARVFPISAASRHCPAQPYARRRRCHPAAGACLPGLSRRTAAEIRREAAPGGGWVGGSVPDEGVRTGKEERLLAALLPAHEVGRAALRPANLEDFALVVRHADAVVLHDDVVTELGSHVRLLSVLRSILGARRHHR